MRLKAIICQVFTREAQLAVSRSPHQVDVEFLPMGAHELGNKMRPLLQHRIDAADGQGYDAIVLGFALCGRGTEGLRAGKTPVVIPRAHDCIDILMGGHSKSMAYFETHPGVYYRSPGWVEFLEASNTFQPASMKNVFGDRRPLTELIAKYGEEDGRYLQQQHWPRRGKQVVVQVSEGAIVLPCLLGRNTENGHQLISGLSAWHWSSPRLVKCQRRRA